MKAKLLRPWILFPYSNSSTLNLLLLWLSNCRKLLILGCSFTWCKLLIVFMFVYDYNKDMPLWIGSMTLRIGLLPSPFQSVVSLFWCLGPSFLGAVISVIKVYSRDALNTGSHVSATQEKDAHTCAIGISTIHRRSAKRQGSLVTIRARLDMSCVFLLTENLMTDRHRPRPRPRPRFRPRQGPGAGTGTGTGTGPGAGAAVVQRITYYCRTNVRRTMLPISFIDNFLLNCYIYIYIYIYLL